MGEETLLRKSALSISHHSINLSPLDSGRIHVQLDSIFYHPSDSSQQHNLGLHCFRSVYGRCEGPEELLGAKSFVLCRWNYSGVGDWGRWVNVMALN